MISGFLREARFLLRSTSAKSVFVAAFLLSCFAIWSGLNEVSHQNAEIDALLEADKVERAEALADHPNYGGAAYYVFHLTYDRPSNLAFAALGDRDVMPWKHRIRMLALEGQIYESDAGNPALAGIGRFDYSFLVAFILPLLVILLLHDLRASERQEGRYELLVATRGNRLWIERAGARSILLLLAVWLPFVGGAVLSSVPPLMILLVLALTAFSVLFWALVAFFFARFSFNGPTNATALLGVWLVLSFIIPSLGELAIGRSISAPEGGDIVLLQRETVNDAWDLPKEVTMDAFVEKHPEWAGQSKIERPFEWKWYFAFQQVGDQAAGALSQEYRAAIRARYKAAGVVSYASPSAFSMRAFSALAETDRMALLAYEERVRAFHASLRHFHYPLLFNNPEFAISQFDELPRYTE